MPARGKDIEYVISRCNTVSNNEILICLFSIARTWV